MLEVPGGCVCSMPPRENGCLKMIVCCLMRVDIVRVLARRCVSRLSSPPPPGGEALEGIAHQNADEGHDHGSEHPDGVER
jgi:hypothetical protein